MNDMDAGLLKDITDNRFLLILLEEKAYVRKLENIVRSVEKTKSKICYLCLSKPYADVVDDLNNKGVDIDDFIFIDVLSSHYEAPKPADNCIFISSPDDMEDIRKAIVSAVDEKNCSVVVFDTISTLLIYQHTSSIVKFTSNIVSEKRHENTKKLFIILKDEGVPVDDVNMLTKDLEMFADKKIDMTKNEDINNNAA